MENRKIVAVLLSLVWASGAWAGLEITKDMYRAPQMAEAQAEARAKGKAVCILYTDADSTCPLAAQAARDAIDALDSRVVVVYVNARGEHEALPAAAKTSLNSPESGKFIPKTVVLDAELGEVIVLIPYAKGQERKDLLTDAKRTITAWLKNKGGSASAAPAAGGADPSVARIWTSVSGKTLEGRFVKLQQEIVFLETADGSTMQIPLTKLSAADQVAARQLSAVRR